MTLAANAEPVSRPTAERTGLAAEARAPAPFIRSLEPMRGLAACWVALFHAAWLFPGCDANLLRNGYLMVDFFFVLSGFVIVHSYGDKLSSLGDIWRFMILRFGRLYPVHFVMLAVFLAIEIARYGAHYPGAFSVNDGVALGANLLLLQAMGVLQSTSFNPVSWSISAEFYAYVVFAFATWAIPVRLRALAAAAIVAICIGVLASFGFHSIGVPIEFSLFRCLIGFFAGVLAHEAYVRLHLGSAPALLLQIGLGLALLIVLSVSAPSEGDIAAFALFPFLILAFALGDGTILARTLELPPFAWLGRVSYSIYMTHFFVCWALLQVIQKILRLPVVKIDDASIVAPTPVLAFALLAVYAALTLCASSLMYRFVELPFRRRSRDYVGALAAKSKPLRVARPGEEPGPQLDARPSRAAR